MLEKKFDYTEFDKLVDLCKKENYETSVSELNGGKQIIVYKDHKRVCDAVIHQFSYGHEQGLLEFMFARDVLGFLDAKTCATMIKGSIAIYEALDGKVMNKNAFKKLEEILERSENN